MAISAVVKNGWCLLAHSLFLEQFEMLTRQVEILRQKEPIKYIEKNSTKRLAAINKLIFEKIPQDPTLSEYWQGKTLGQEYKHWFRAKFFQQYRLFFRYHLESKIIVYVWINDENTLRAYESKSDVYLIFRKMLKNGYPPNDWDTLLKQAKEQTTHFNKYTVDSE